MFSLDLIQTGEDHNPGVRIKLAKKRRNPEPAGVRIRLVGDRRRSEAWTIKRGDDKNPGPAGARIRPAKDRRRPELWSTG